MRGQRPALDRADPGKLHGRRSRAEQVFFPAGRQAKVHGRRDAVALRMVERVFRSRDDVGQADRFRARRRLRELAAAIRVDARAGHRQPHERRRDADFQPVGDADVAVERRHARVDVERQLIDVERRGLVGELVRGRHERPVTQAAAVERRERRCSNVTPARRLSAAGGLRAFDEERTEGLRRAFDRAQLRVQLIHESADEVGTGSVAMLASSARKSCPVVACAATRSRSTLPVCTDWLVNRKLRTLCTVCAPAGAAGEQESKGESGERCGG